MNTDPEKKNGKSFSSFIKSTVDIGKKAASCTKTSVSSMVEKIKSDSYARKLKKLNPLFPEQFQNETFALPNIITIVDDAVRRGIEMCEGAIGWLNSDSGAEVLYLYDEAIEFSGLQFIPNASCDSVYYVDSYNRNRFIRTDCIFQKAHEERMAELKHIAYCLGAKRCTIEICEASSDTQTQSKNAQIRGNIKGAANTESMEQNFSRSGEDRRSGHIEIEFEGDNAPQKPTLKWFAHEDTITRLIEMCCNGKRAIKSETLELSGSSSATMSQNAAYAIDNVLGTIGKSSYSISMNSQAAKEHHSKLLFHIEF